MRFVIGKSLFLGLIGCGLITAPIVAKDCHPHYRHRTAPPPKVVMFDQPVSAAGSIRSPVAQGPLPSYGIKPVAPLKPLELRAAKQPTAPTSESNRRIRSHPVARANPVSAPQQVRAPTIGGLRLESFQCSDSFAVPATSSPLRSKERYVDVVVRNTTEGFLLFDEYNFIGTFSKSEEAVPDDAQTLRINEKTASRYERLIPAGGTATIRLTWDQDNRTLPKQVELR